jgi:hypothetical protein
MRKAELPENAPEAHLGQINAKARAKNPLEIDATPARNPILLRIGASLHEAPQLCGSKRSMPLWSWRFSITSRSTKV